MGSTGGLQRRAGGSIRAWWGSPSPPRTEQRRNWCGWEGSRSNPSWRAGRPASALHVAPGCKAGRKGRCQPPAHEELGETEGWMLLTASCRAARGASQQPPRWRDLTPSECQRPAALGACPGGGPHTPSPPWHGSNHAQESPAPRHSLKGGRGPCKEVPRGLRLPLAPWRGLGGVPGGGQPQPFQRRWAQRRAERGLTDSWLVSDAPSCEARSRASSSRPGSSTTKL